MIKDIFFGTRPFSIPSPDPATTVLERLNGVLGGNGQLEIKDTLQVYQGGVDGSLFTYQLRQQGFNGNMIATRTIGQVVEADGKSALVGTIGFGKTAQTLMSACILLIGVVFLLMGIPEAFEQWSLNAALKWIGMALLPMAVFAVFIYIVATIKRTSEANGLRLLLHYSAHGPL